MKRRRKNEIFISLPENGCLVLRKFIKQQIMSYSKHTLSNNVPYNRYTPSILLTQVPCLEINMVKATSQSPYCYKLATIITTWISFRNCRLGMSTTSHNSFLLHSIHFATATPWTPLLTPLSPAGLVADTIWLVPLSTRRLEETRE